VSDSAGHRLTTLPSGIRVVSEALPGVRSAAIGFFAATGSATEPSGQAGWSHLLEHLLFRGTARYGSAQIDEIFDAMGAELNAGTGRESTSVYTRVLDEHMGRAFDVMADMIWRPAIGEAEIASEPEIVLEELAMYEDDPQDMVFDLLGEATFGEHPLGRPVIGTRETVTAATAETLRGFHGARYVPQDVVVAAAGSVEHDALVELVRAAQGGGPADGRAPSMPACPPEGEPHTRFSEKPTEQVHLTLGAPGLARDDERRFALRVLDTILGGTSSSRLFQEVREKRALAYSVSSFHAQYAGTGQVGIYLGTRPENLATAIEVVAHELRRLLEDGVSEDELQRAKENARGRAVLALESTSARMNRLGGALLAGLPVLSIDELIARVDAVACDDVVELARELLAPERLSAAAIGPSEAAFRTALEPAMPALAEAA
jgi:predicted Zn-dependent peptidase